MAYNDGRYSLKIIILILEVPQFYKKYISTFLPSFVSFKQKLPLENSFERYGMI